MSVDLASIYDALMLIIHLQAQSHIAIFTTVCEIGSDGSGPIKVDPLASFFVTFYYRCQRKKVMFLLFVCLSVCLCARLLKKL